METTREILERRYAELKQERTPWLADWRSISDEILPYRARWSSSEKNRSGNLTLAKPNSTPMESLLRLAAGMVSHVTSPMRPWFHLTTPYPELNEQSEVKHWLATAEEAIRSALMKSNFYKALASGVYFDLGLIGTSCLMCQEREGIERGGVWFEALPIGEYCLDADDEGRIDTVFRERSFTARQLIESPLFGWDAVSDQVRDAYNNKHLARSFDVIHAIFPNADYDRNAVGPRGKRWVSKWWENNEQKGRFLREGGYEEFPAMCPRWMCLSGEVYGRGPGWWVLGDARSLQHQEKRLAELVDKTARPPMRAVDTLRSARASLLPGDITYVPAGVANSFEPAIQIPPAAIVAVQDHIARHEDRTRRAYFVDLWLTLLNDTRNSRPTATEVEATKQEVLLQLGPVVEALNDELLEPSISRVGAILLRKGLIPPQPEAMDGMEIRTEFESIAKQAQKMVGIAGIRELLAHIAALAQLGRPDAVDKLDADKMVDELASMAGVKADLIKTEEQVSADREAKAAQLQGQQEGQALLGLTQGLKNIGQTDPQNLSDVANVLSPTVAAGAGLQ